MHMQKQFKFVPAILLDVVIFMFYVLNCIIEIKLMNYF